MTFAIKLFLIVFALCTVLSSVFAQATRHGSEPSVIWMVNSTSDGNDTCILFRGNLELAVPFENLEGMIDVAVIPIPSNATASGNCGTNSVNETLTQTLTLTWKVEGSDSSDDLFHNITFVFLRHGEPWWPYISDAVFTGYYGLHETYIQIHTNPVQFVNALEPAKIYNMSRQNLELWEAPMDVSYGCDSDQYMDFGNGILQVSGVQLRVFHRGPAMNGVKDFGLKSLCTKDSLKMVATVVMYICILGLIALVIVCALQRRYRRVGYVRVP